jgi:hypothetical protein
MIVGPGRYGRGTGRRAGLKNVFSETAGLLV